MSDQLKSQGPEWARAMEPTETTNEDGSLVLRFDTNRIKGAWRWWMCFVLFVETHYFLWAAWLVAPVALLCYLQVVPWSLLIGVCTAYLIWLFSTTPHLNGGWRPTCLGLPIWNWAMYFLDATVIREAPYDEDRPLMFAMVPHGVFCMIRNVTFVPSFKEKLFPKADVAWGAFGAGFYVPGVREISLLCGAVDAGKPSMQTMAQSGRSICLAPGGVTELLWTDMSKTTRLVARFGFVKLAIEEGMDIVPCFCFGEKWCNRFVSPPAFIRDFIYRTFRIAVGIYVGHMGTMFPYPTHKGRKVRLGWVFGKPIKVKQIKAPSKADVQEIYAQYEAALHAIFKRYKSEFGYDDDEKLVIVQSTVKADTKKKD